jgi:glycosyltransferase involved in cell wall biosynthesis
VVATVSVVIPCFNGERYLGEAVRSVLAQTHAGLEVIVVDDGSTDRSVSVVRNVSDARVRVVSQPNGGVAAARNRGVAETSGEYVAFLDQDDAWLPTKLELQLASLRRSPEVGLVYSDCFLIDADGTEIGRWSERFPLLRGRLFERLIVESVVPISTVLLRRSTFAAAGGFPPQYRYVEDLALLLRVAAGHAIDVIEAPVAKYRLHSASTSRTLGLEVAAEELITLCREWIVGDASRGAVVSRALGRYLYIAGKTAFYQGQDVLAARYLTESARSDPMLRTRLFALLAQRCPRLLLRGRALLKRLAGQAGPVPGTFPERFA